ncbi:MAG: FK506 suppressor Sfk1 [Lasallia pustulata]|uniref:FK506 suppressor Sfk1 n=1 Tax=Lasallia pustulata TaxID=136370 RepID=A0A5M8Q1K6_9LECA|nr:MAG: FK506 suppressor Sfk1 [Lasallia pustulata]
MWYLSFWIFPLISAFTWLGMLLAMFIVWEVKGHPHYASMSTKQHIAYISDIGAQGLKPLFIAGCCVTTIFLDLSFLSERWLRHKGQLARNTGVAEKWLSALSIVFAIAGTCGLILLSIFDTLRHPHLHDGFLLLFIAGYLLSAVFICAEYQRLGVHFREHRILRISFWVKLAFILVEVAIAVAFAVTNFTNGTENVAAVLEWVVALIFTFYVLTFFIDLLPAVRNKHHTGSGAPQVEMGHANGGSHLTDGYSSNGQVPLNGQSGYADEPHINGVGHRTAAGGDRYYENGGYENGPLPGQHKPIAAQNF